MGEKRKGWIRDALNSIVINRRTHITPSTEFRSQTNDDGTHTISGYCAMFSVLSREMPSAGSYTIREQLAPGCFDSALASSDLDVTLNWNHSDQFILARTTNGSLKLSTDAIGLRFEANIAPTSYASDLGVLMSSGILNQCSFAFTVDPDDIETTTVNGQTVETIRSITTLYDCAICTRGAYPQPFAAYRSNEQALNEIIANAMKAFAEQNPEVPEVRTNNGSEETLKASEVHKNKVARAVALLDLQYKQIH